MRTRYTCLVLVQLAMAFMAGSVQALTTPEVVEKAQRAIVTIKTGSSLGSGVIIDKSGAVLTCYHVYDGDSPAVIKTADGAIYEADGLVSSDPSQDIAVTQIRVSEPKGMPYLPLGESAKLKPGEDIIAIGSPIGFEKTVTKGTVSAIRTVRDCPEEFRKWLMQNGRSYDDSLVQFTAPVAPGSSGCPLINTAGEVVGVCIIGYGAADNMYFAVPVDVVKPLLPHTSPASQSQPGSIGGGSSPGLSPPVLVLIVLALFVIAAMLVLVTHRVRGPLAAPETNQVEGLLDWIAVGKTVCIQAEPVTIGRSSQCTIVLDEPKVSRKHALVARVGDQFAITDLGSKMGTYVNGIRCERCVLRNGDRIVISSTELAFRTAMRPAESDLVQGVPERREG